MKLYLYFRNLYLYFQVETHIYLIRRASPFAKLFHVHDIVKLTTLKSSRVHLSGLYVVMFVPLLQLLDNLIMCSGYGLDSSTFQSFEPLNLASYMKLDLNFQFHQTTL